MFRTSGTCSQVLIIVICHIALNLLSQFVNCYSHEVQQRVALGRTGNAHFISGCQVASDAGRIAYIVPRLPGSVRPTAAADVCSQGGIIKCKLLHHQLHSCSLINVREKIKKNVKNAFFIPKIKKTRPSMTE